MEEMEAERQAADAAATSQAAEAAALSKESSKPAALTSQKSSFAAVDEVPEISMLFWLKAAAVAVVCIAIPITLVLVRDLDATASADQHYYSVMAPLIILGLFEYFIQMKLAPKLGLDMLEEASPGVSIKTAVKTNMVQQGLLATFLLAIVAAMLRHPLSPPRERLLGQWYEGLLILSFGMLVSSLCLARLLLMYLEPLDEKATLVFMGNNLAYDASRPPHPVPSLPRLRTRHRVCTHRYFGEPLAAAGIAVVNGLMAVSVWVCGVYGLPLAIVTFVIFFIIITRLPRGASNPPHGLSFSRLSNDARSSRCCDTGVLVVAQNLSSFVNAQVDNLPGERETRRKWAAKAAGYGTMHVKATKVAIAPVPETTRVVPVY